MSDRPILAAVPSSRQLLIVAQDPSVRDSEGRIITSLIDVPFEPTAPGPKGARVYVVDYDASTGEFNPPSELLVDLTKKELSEKKLTKKELDRLMDNSAFRAHNAYAIVMRVLARFEFALGRRLSWGFDGHQLHVAPTAFVDANAFYSNRDRGLFLGYFDTEKNGKRGSKRVYTCLSHDVVAHETTHALLDGLRTRFTEPSSDEQAAFHEGFADVVALLSIFSVPGLVQKALDLKEVKDTTSRSNDPRAVARKWLKKEALKEGVLLGLGEEMADPNERLNALRRSVRITPEEANAIRTGNEAHRLGELIVAAVMNAFLDIWLERLSTVGPVYGKEGMDRSRVAEEGRVTADYLLTMIVRAIDYTPTVDIRFSDFLSALLTADLEIRPVDRYEYRARLLHNFKLFGIEPTSDGFDGHPAVWEPPRIEMDYSNTVFESMQRDADEVFRFVWQNRDKLCLYEPAYTRVESVRPCIRISPAGFVLRETVVEYVQILNVRAHELASLPWDEPQFPPQKPVKLETPVKPPEMPGNLSFRLYGGGALIFSDRGELKYHVRSKILNAKRQRQRLHNLWDSGFFSSQNSSGKSLTRRFADMHRRRRLGATNALTKDGPYGESF